MDYQKEHLLDEAFKASKNSYSPYSNFPVGAAVLCDDGTIVRGCNIENASFSLTSCGERVALFAAISKGKKPVELAVVCAEATDGPLRSRMPCGACRQVIAEHMPAKALVHIDKDTSYRVKDLLPKAFSLKR